MFPSCKSNGFPITFIPLVLISLAMVLNMYLCVCLFPFAYIFYLSLKKIIFLWSFSTIQKSSQGFLTKDSFLKFIILSSLKYIYSWYFFPNCVKNFPDHNDSEEKHSSFIPEFNGKALNLSSYCLIFSTVLWKLILSYLITFPLFLFYYEWLCFINGFLESIVRLICFPSFIFFLAMNFLE